MARNIQNGDFCWFELQTPDLEGASQFYAKLFDWKVESILLENSERYVFFKTENGNGVGGGEQITAQEFKDGKKGGWESYVQVANAEAMVREAVEMGGKVITPPKEIMKSGVLSNLIDPLGVRFSVWEPKEIHERPIQRHLKGEVGWIELICDENETAGDFYEDLFEWEATSSPLPSGESYLEFINADVPVAGLTKKDPKRIESNALWMPYFTVESCEDTLKKVEQLGGEVVVPITEIPEIGHFFEMKDREGVAFSAIEFSPALIEQAKEDARLSQQ